MKTIDTQHQAEKEMAAWFKDLRKHTLGLTQKELAELAGVPLGTLRHFEQTGQTSLRNFLRIAEQLRVIDLFSALARGEEPVTFHKIQKEKMITRLRDELSMQRSESTPMEVRKRNTRTTSATPIRKWRLHGRKKWMPLPATTTSLEV